MTPAAIFLVGLVALGVIMWALTGPDTGEEEGDEFDRRQW